MSGPGIVKVLVADDAETLRDLLVRALERDPEVTVVATAGNGRDAIDRTREHDPDVVLLDLSMPILDGMAVLAEIGSQYPVVVLSGYGEGDMGSECFGLGARAFIEKGTPVREILQALKGAAR